MKPGNILTAFNKTLRLRRIRELGLEKGVIALFGAKKKKALVEKVTDDGYIVLQGHADPFAPKHIWGTTVSEEVEEVIE